MARGQPLTAPVLALRALHALNDLRIDRGAQGRRAPTGIVQPAARYRQQLTHHRHRIGIDIRFNGPRPVASLGLPRPGVPQWLA